MARENGVPVCWLILALCSTLVAVWLAALDLPLASDGVISVRLAEDLRAGSFTEIVAPPGLPALMVLLGVVVDSTELAGRLVMVLSAAVLPVLVALVCRPILGRRWAVAGGFLWLAFPLHAEVAAGIWTEPLFFDLALAFLLLPDGLGDQDRRMAPLRGALGGLAYLVRPEGLVVFALDASIRFGCSVREHGRRSVVVLGVSVLVLSLFVVPYVGYLHSQTGEWMLSGKSSYNSAIADRMSSENIWQLPSPPASDTGLSSTARRYVRNARKVHDSFLALMTLPALLLIGCGLYRLSRVKQQGGVLRTTVLLAAPTAVMPVYFFVETRLLYGLCLACVPLLAVGLHRWVSARPEATGPTTGPLRPIGLLLALATLALWGHGWLGALDRGESASTARRTLGRSVSERAAGRALMSISRITSHYAGAQDVALPRGIPLEELLREARQQEAVLVEVSTYDAEAFHPTVLRLLDAGAVDPRLERVGQAVLGGETFACFEILGGGRAK